MTTPDLTSESLSKKEKKQLQEEKRNAFMIRLQNENSLKVEEIKNKIKRQDALTEKAKQEERIAISEKITDVYTVLDGLRSDINEKEDSKEPVTHNYIAEELMKINNYITFEDTREIYVYHGGVYLPYGEVLIEKNVQSIFDDKVKNQFVKEVIGCILRTTFTPRKDLDLYPRLLVVKNGILNIDTGELKLHSPDHLSIIKLNITFDSKAECPKIEKFLNEIVLPEHIIILKEWIAYTLEPSYFIHKALMLVGEENAGKSTYLKLLTKFIGVDYTSNEPLQDICHRWDSIANLDNKFINTCADLSNVKLTYTGRFKELTGGDRVKGRQLYRKSFYFYNRCKLAFSTNTLPKTQDVTRAYFKRWLIIHFPNKFGDENPNTDKRLIENLSENEMSGLLNIALKHLKTLQEKQCFSYKLNVEETKEYYTILSEPIISFVQERCELDSEGELSRSELSNAFNKYAAQKNLSKMNQTPFTKEFKKHYPELDNKSRIKIKGKYERSWRGIRLKKENEYEEYEETLQSFDENQDNTIDDELIKCSETILRNAGGEMGLTAFLDKLSKSGYIEKKETILTTLENNGFTIGKNTISLKDLKENET